LTCLAEEEQANSWKERRRRFRRQPNDHNFGSLLMLAVTAGAFLVIAWVATKGLFFFLQESPIR
jgi:hypothetical protein